MASNVTFRIDWDYDPDKKSGLTVKGVFCGNAEEIPVPLYMAILKAMLQVEDLLNGEDQLEDVYVPHPGLQITSPGESQKEAGDVIEDALKMEGGAPVKLKPISPDPPPPPAPAYPPIRRNQ